MNEEQLEKIADRKLEWLQDRGLTSDEVMVDDDGIEYVVEEPTLMDEGEPEDGRPVRVDLPDFSKE